MTDLSSSSESRPSRLGATARFVDDDLLVELEPRPAVLHEGVVRASVLSYLIDCVAGIPLDGDPDAWTLTTDMTVRTLARPAPARITSRATIVRRGRRSATSVVDLHGDDGSLVATGAIGFARVPRRDDDPPKVHLTVDAIIAMFARSSPVEEAVRAAAGIEVVDAAAGVVEVALTASLRNPAGTLQGAMVALVAEAAAEEVLGARAGRPVVVTDLDLRYLDRTGAGPVRTRTTVLGDGVDAAVVVELVDRSTDTVTTLVHARGTTVPVP